MSAYITTYKLSSSRLLFLVLIATALPLLAAGPPSKPNIVFILTDDMGYGDPACYGGKMVPTPNIDRLASEGTRFTQFYVPAPVCSPSRAGLLTGNFPARWKITNYLQTRAGNRASEQADFLDPEAPSIARTLKAAGYVTGHFGKWHMGGGRDVTNAPPFSAYGFDEHVGTYESPEPDPMITATDWIWSAQDQVKRWNRTAYLVDKALDFLKRHQSMPCYVSLWPDDVHTPWVPEGSDLTKRHFPENAAHFKPVLAEYDKQVGRFLEGLRQLRLDGNTVVIFSSDNGPQPTLDRSRTAGLRGAKDSLYEGGIREPLIVRWPHHTPAARVDKTTVLAGTDFFPTFCRLAGIPLPTNVKLDGEDMSRAFLGHTLARKRPLFWEYGRNETFGYPREYPGQRSPNVAMREGKWKLLINVDGANKELYDLDSDPNETTNVAGKYPKVARRMADAALNWRKSVQFERLK